MRRLFIVVVSLAAWTALGASPKPGAFQPATIAQDEIGAAQFAVREEGRKEQVPLSLSSIIEALRQTVAGTNFRLRLIVAKGDEKKEARALVFRGLDRHYELKSWDWLAQ